MCFSMGKGRKVLQKIYLGIIGGVCGSFFILVFGYLWHSFLGHSHGFGFFSLNAFGWILLAVFVACVGSVKGLFVGLVDLLGKAWLTLIASLLIWGIKPSMQAFQSIKRPEKALSRLDIGYVVIFILAAVLCALIVIKGSDFLAYIRREKSKTKEELNEDLQKLSRGQGRLHASPLSIKEGENED